MDLASRLACARVVRGGDGAVDDASTGPVSGFHDLGLVRASARWGARSFHHTALLPMRRRRGRELLVTADAARPIRIAPAGMEVQGPLGGPWRPAAFRRRPFPLYLTTAHPVHDPASDELFSVNYGRGFLDVLRWDEADRVTRTALVDDGGRPLRVRQTMHQLALTERYLLLADTSFHVGAEQLGLGRLTRRRGLVGALARRLLRGPPAAHGRLWWVRRDLIGREATAKAVGVDLPGGIAHLLADFDDEPALRVHLVQGRGLDLAAWLTRGDRLAHRPECPVDEDLLGMVAGPSDVGVFACLRLDPTTGRIVEAVERWDPELTWCPGLYAGVGVGVEDAVVRRHRSLWWFTVGLTPDLATEHVVARTSGRRLVAAERLRDLLRSGGLPSRVLRLEGGTLDIEDVATVPDDVTVGAPQLVPAAPGSDGPGWLSLVAWTPQRAELWLYHPFDLRRGPVCRLAAPEFDPGFLMHPAWTPGVEG